MIHVCLCLCVDACFLWPSAWLVCVCTATSDLTTPIKTDEDDLKSICFVCNIDRFTADQNGIGFDKHVKLEHYPKVKLPSSAALMLFRYIYRTRATPSVNYAHPHSKVS